MEIRLLWVQCCIHSLFLAEYLEYTVCCKNFPIMCKEFILSTCSMLLIACDNTEIRCLYKTYYLNPEDCKKYNNYIRKCDWIDVLKYWMLAQVSSVDGRLLKCIEFSYLGYYTLYASRAREQSSKDLLLWVQKSDL